MPLGADAAGRIVCDMLTELADAALPLPCRPLIVCLGLKEHSQEAVKQLLGVVEQQQLL